MGRLASDLLIAFLMKKRHAFVTFFVALVLTPVALFGALLLVPVALLLLALLPFVGVTALSTLILGASRAPDSVASPPLTMPRAGAFSG
ncbi:MAG TPA: hypothetical protein VFK02_09910 [Kofleriaceae bacterium]|nr:hypothetical protein [Kofleriaceae bacterium]